MNISFNLPNGQLKTALPLQETLWSGKKLAGITIQTQWKHEMVNNIVFL